MKSEKGGSKKGRRTVTAQKISGISDKARGDDKAIRRLSSSFYARLVKAALQAQA